MTQAQWAAALLSRLNIQPSKANTRAIVGWMNAEGGHWNNSAKFNPLNTTQPMPGAGNTGSQGNIKVYTSWNQGLDATVKTLRNGRYGAILNALKGNDAGAVAGAIGKTPWGTSAALVAKTIGAAPSSSGVVSAATKAASGTTTATPPSYQAGSTQPDATGALVDVLMARARSGTSGKGGLLQQLQGALDSGQYTSTTPGTWKDGSVKTTPGTATPTAAGGAKGLGPLLEMFWQGQGGIDVKNGKVVPQGFVDGHTDHVHVASGPKTVVELGKIAQQMGLHVGENSHFNGGKRVTAGHATNSYHYKDQAIDVSGDPKKMAAYAKTIARKYRLK